MLFNLREERPIVLLKFNQNEWIAKLKYSDAKKEAEIIFLDTVIIEERVEMLLFFPQSM